MDEKARYFNVEDRRREKQAARDRDLRLIASGEVAPELISRRNGLFSSLDHAQVRLIERQVQIHLR